MTVTTKTSLPKAKVDVGRVKYESANCGHKWNKQEFLGTGHQGRL